MKPGMKKIVIGLIGLIPFVGLRSSFAAGSASSGEASTTVSASDVDSQTLIDYQDLIRTYYGISSDIVNLNYHDESQTVDLSTFDGNTVTVPIHEMRVGSPNGEGGTT
jgi:hypothetical protein